MKTAPFFLYYTQNDTCFSCFIMIFFLHNVILTERQIVMIIAVDIGNTNIVVGGI